jgi:hypothetical protein
VNEERGGTVRENSEFFSVVFLGVHNCTDCCQVAENPNKSDKGNIDKKKFEDGWSIRGGSDQLWWQADCMVLDKLFNLLVISVSTCFQYFQKDKSVELIVQLK